MKKNILFFIAIWFCNIANAQNFKSDITSTIGSNEGGQLNLTNSLKIGKNVKTWTLFNMTGPYGNGLNFWAYAADGTNLGPKMTLSDDGSLNVNTGSIFSRNGSVYASLNSNEGPFLSLINPGKTANGTANDWRIYNMTGSYGNSLQFWNYGNGGFYGSRFTILDNGNVGIGTNAPESKLHISSKGNSGQLDYNLILQKTIVSDNDKSAVGLLFSTECCGPFGKSAIVHERTGGYGIGNLHFLNNNAIDISNPTLINSRMTISSAGNVGIGTTVPADKLSVSAGAITVGFGNMDKATLQGGSGFGSLLRLFYADGKETVRIDAGGGGGTSWINSGNLLIGKTSQINSAYRLDVNGTIRSNEIRVNLDGADFVFEEKYPLMPLTELEAYVKKNKHLPEIAPAKEMQEQGSNLGDLNTKLLQKIEELTLYVIEQQKLITQQAKELESHKVKLTKIDQIEKSLARINAANEK